MRRILTPVLVVIACAMPLMAFAQAGLRPANPVPGGLTLVPGTVVVPGVGGSAVTGTVPLAGTQGSAGVGTFDPALGSALNPAPSGNSNALYPPGFYPQTGNPDTLQSTMPQSDPADSGVTGAVGTGSTNGVRPRF